MEPILASERLLFRPHLSSDIDDFCAMEMDIHVRRYVGGYPRSREVAEQRFPGNQSQNMLTDRLAQWATVLKSENSYIGRCGLVPHFDQDGKPIAGEAALGYYIAHKYWGQKFATESGQAFIQFGFHELRLTKIVATVQEGNDASVHILQKLGFALTDTEKGERTFCRFSLQNPTLLPG